MNKYQMHHHPLLRWGTQALIMIWMVSMCALMNHDTAYAQSDPARIHQTQVEAIKVRQQTQKSEENWFRKKGEVKAHYQSLKSTKEILAHEKAVIQEQIAILKNRQAEAERKISETAHIGQKLQSHLDGLIVRMEENIARDLPFLTQERT